MLPPFDLIEYGAAGGDNPPPHWQFQYWTTTRGKKMHVSDMAVRHIQNAKLVVQGELMQIDHLIEQNPYLQWSFLLHYHVGLRERWIKTFENELRGRGVLDG